MVGSVMTRPEPSIFNDHDEEADARSLAEAEADIAAGRLVPHADVAEWLKTWGTAEEGPPPTKWNIDG